MFALIPRLFIAGNFLCFSNSDDSGTRPNPFWHGVIRHGDGFDPFHIAFQRGFVPYLCGTLIVGLPVKLIEAPRVERSERNGQIFWHVVVCLVRPAFGGRCRVDFHL